MKQNSQTLGASNGTPVSTALVLVSKPANAGDELATCVASFTAEYNRLDSKIDDLTEELLGQERELASQYRNDLFPMICQMQMLLSQRGALRALVSNNGSSLSAEAELEDVPTWTEWYEAFSSRFEGAKSLRTVQRQLKKMRGKTAPVLAAAVDDRSDGFGADARDSMTFEVANGSDLNKTGRDLLEEHTNTVLDVLTGKSIMSDPMRIKRAVSLVKDLKRALQEGFLLNSPRASAPEAPPIAGERVADPTHSKTEDLRCEILRMADTMQIEKALVSFFQELVGPLLATHPYLPTPRIYVNITRPETRRIVVGDWVEYKGGDGRLMKQIGHETALGRVVGLDKLGRPRIRWNNGSEWKKPYSLFEENAVHVLFDYQAAAGYTAAFKTYPAESHPAQKRDSNQQLCQRALPTKKTAANTVARRGPSSQTTTSVANAAIC